MPDFDPKAFLNTPIYALNFQFMIGDLGDFLDFSESNIDWQYRREMQAISSQDFRETPFGYRAHLEQNAQHRFRVSLPLRVRYGAVLALTTSVEWSMKLLNMNALSPVPEKRDGMNYSVRIMKELSARTDLATDPVIDDYVALVQVRNCIAHAAGLVDSYKYQDDLRAAIVRLQPAFSLGSWHFMGEQVCIERGALDRHIQQMSKVVVDLYRRMHELGLMRNDA